MVARAANTTHRRWPSIGTKLGRCVVFAGRMRRMIFEPKTMRSTNQINRNNIIHKNFKSITFRLKVLACLTARTKSSINVQIIYHVYMVYRQIKHENHGSMYTANTRHCPNVELMLAQRLRRWANINPCPAMPG